jgi:hypothetical protein
MRLRNPPEPVLGREELRSIMFMLADIATNTRRMVELMEEDDDGEEEA